MNQKQQRNEGNKSANSYKPELSKIYSFYLFRPSDDDVDSDYCKYCESCIQPELLLRHENFCKNRR